MLPDSTDLCAFEKITTMGRGLECPKNIAAPFAGVVVPAKFLKNEIKVENIHQSG